MVVASDAAVGQPDAQVGVTVGHRADRGHDHDPPAALHDGVPPLERGQRGQRPGSRALVGDVVVGARQDVVEHAAGAVAQVGDLDRPGVEQGARVGQRGPGPEVGERLRLSRSTS